MVEHNLAKVGVASSSLVFRSQNEEDNQMVVFFHFVLAQTMARTKRPQVAPFRAHCKFPVGSEKYYAKIVLSLYTKNGISLTPRN